MATNEQLQAADTESKRKAGLVNEAMARAQILIEKTPTNERDAVFGDSLIRLAVLTDKIEKLQLEGRTLLPKRYAAPTPSNNALALNLYQRLIAAQDEMLALLAPYAKLSQATPTRGMH